MFVDFAVPAGYRLARHELANCCVQKNFSPAPRATAFTPVANQPSMRSQGDPGEREIGRQREIERDREIERHRETETEI